MFDRVMVSPFEMMIVSAAVYLIMAYITKPIFGWITCKLNGHKIRCPCGSHMVTFSEREDATVISFDNRPDVFALRIPNSEEQQ